MDYFRGMLMVRKDGQSNPKMIFSVEKHQRLKWSKISLLSHLLE
jgi:hypothetical protein